LVIHGHRPYNNISTAISVIYVDAKVLVGSVYFLLYEEMCNMKIYQTFAGDAYLLCRDGTTISVLNHPNSDFEFESIVYVLSEYGDNNAKELAKQYEISATEELRNQILAIYDNTWCKIREWEGRRLVTFRITSTDTFNWYRVIVDFLITHIEYKRSVITVESDKRTGVRKVYWDEIPYDVAISPEQETIMANTRKINN